MKEYKEELKQEEQEEQEEQEQQKQEQTHKTLETEKEATEVEEETVEEETVEEETLKQEEEKQEGDDRLLRLQAEFTNYKRRVEKEKADLYIYGCENLAKDLLPVLDNLERALEATEDKNAGIYKGVELIYQQTLEVFKKHGIQPIETKGVAFDMNKHHAVMTEPCDEDEVKETVAQELQRGYTIDERVLRPAMVKVYK